MESIYSELALCGSNNFCARTDTVFFPISEVSEGTDTLIYIQKLHGQEEPQDVVTQGNIFFALNIFF